MKKKGQIEKHNFYVATVSAHSTFPFLTVSANHSALNNNHDSNFNQQVHQITMIQTLINRFINGNKMSSLPNEIFKPLKNLELL